MIFINRNIKDGEEITQANLELVSLEHFLKLPELVAVRVLDSGDIIIETNTDNTEVILIQARKILARKLGEIKEEEKEARKRLKILSIHKKAIKEQLEAKK